MLCYAMLCYVMFYYIILYYIIIYYADRGATISNDAYIRKAESIL